MDEPQELLFEWRPTARETGAGVWLITQLRARHRWALSATPGSSDAEKRDIVSLTFGARLSRLEFRKVRNRWTSQRTKRDPPDMCLPTVPLHPQCVPVTLSWREAATVQLYTESFDATFANVVRYCGGWCDAAGDAEELEALDSFDFLGGDAGDGKVESLDQWHARLAHVMDVKLGKLETRRDVLVGVISEAETFADDQLKNEGGYNPFDQLDDLLTSEALFDEDDAEGWDGTGGGWIYSKCGKQCVRACVWGFVIPPVTSLPLLKPIMKITSPTLKGWGETTWITTSAISSRGRFQTKTNETRRTQNL